MSEAIALYLEELRGMGAPIPEPTVTPQTLRRVEQLSPLAAAPGPLVLGRADGLLAPPRVEVMRRSA
jgi:hypothetical protein